MFVEMLQQYLSFLLETADSNFKKTGIFGAFQQTFCPSCYVRALTTLATLAK